MDLPCNLGSTGRNNYFETKLKVNFHAFFTVIILLIMQKSVTAKLRNLLFMDSPCNLGSTGRNNYYKLLIIQTILNHWPILVAAIAPTAVPGSVIALRSLRPHNSTKAVAWTVLEVRNEHWRARRGDAFEIADARLGTGPLSPSLKGATYQFADVRMTILDHFADAPVLSPFDLTSGNESTGMNIKVSKRVTCEWVRLFWLRRAFRTLYTRVHSSHEVIAFPRRLKIYYQYRNKTREAFTHILLHEHSCSTIFLNVLY